MKTFIFVVGMAFLTGFLIGDAHGFISAIAALEGAPQ